MANDTIGSLVAVTTVTAGQFTAGMKEIESSLDATHAHAASLDWGEAFKLDVAFEAIHEGIEKAKEAIEGFFESIERVGQLKNFSEQVGATTQEIQGLRYAAEQFHVSSEALDGALTKMQKNIGELNAGGKSAVDVFARLGLSAKDFAGLSAEQSFEKIGDKIKALKNHADETYATMEIFGKGAANLVNVFNAGSEAISKFETEAKAAGIILSDEDVEAAEQAELAMKNLHIQWEAMTNHLIKDAEPVLKVIADDLRDVEKYLTVHAEEVTKSALGWAKIAAEITAVVVIVPRVVSGVREIVTVLKEMTETESIAEALSGPEGIAALAAGLVAAGAAVAAVEVGFDKLGKSADEALDAIKKAAAEAKKSEDEHKDSITASAAAVKIAKTGIDVYTDSIQTLANAIAGLNAEMDKNAAAMAKQGQQITDSLRTPVEKFNATMMEMRLLLANNAISLETFRRASEKALDGFTKDWKAAHPMPEFHATPGVGAALANTIEGFSAVASGERRAADEKDYQDRMLQYQQQFLNALEDLGFGGNGIQSGGIPLDTSQIADF